MTETKKKLASIDARLFVGLRGPDLTASTAWLTLVEKMGFGDRLVGLKRWDFFHLTLDSSAAPASTKPDVIRRVSLLAQYCSPFFLLSHGT